jgi:hypothetical protein
MPKEPLEEQVVVRISSPLRAELEMAAIEDRRPLAALVRNVLSDYAAQRQASRGQGRAAQ